MCLSQAVWIGSVNGVKGTINNCKLHVEKDGSITLTLSDKLMSKLRKGIHEFVITIGGMEALFSIEIK